MRSFIKFFLPILLFTIIITASITPSFAYVSNVVTGSSTVSLKHGTNTTISTYDNTFPYGETHFLQIGSLDYSNTFITVNSVINISDDVNTLYIAYNTSHTGVSFSGLSSYRNTSLDISITDTTRRDIGLLVYSDSDGWSFDSEAYSKPTSGWSVTLAAFSNVPAGTYTIRDTYQYTYDEQDPTYQDTYIFGIYVSYGSSGGSGGGSVNNNNFEGIINNFELGNISYSEAQDYIRNTLDDALASAETTDEKQFYINEANTYLAQLDRSAGYQYISDLDAIKQGMDSIIDSYSSGNLSLNDAMSDLSTYYLEKLNSCDSVDEAQALTSVYNSTMSNLQLSYEVKVQEQLDSVFEDPDGSRAEAEQSMSEMLSAFSYQEMQDALAFSEWFTLFSTSEASTFKTFFDYLVDESYFKFFIMIPICLCIISVLLSVRVIIPSFKGIK